MLLAIFQLDKTCLPDYWLIKIRKMIDPLAIIDRSIDKSA